ncbi:unnamed protein product [Amoebophrya sp. A120]|nr:unnamed protein product [Amoebophrya sp. A120]|eukprot:GSA120T00012817001.1
MSLESPPPLLHHPPPEGSWSELISGIPLLDEMWQWTGLGDDVVFYAHLLLVAVIGFVLFVLDANPGNAGYVCSHFVFPEDIPYELFYNPVLDMISRWLTAGSWIWPTRANVKTVEVEESLPEKLKRSDSFLALEKRDKGGRCSAASPTFCSKVPPKSGAVLVEKERQAKYTMLPRAECEFQQFPPHKLDTDLWFKLRVIWGYLKIAAAAVVKENLWFVQWLFKLEPGYSFFTRSKRTGFQALFIEHAFQMYEDCWNRPICGAPASTVEVVFRERKDQPLLAPYLPLSMTTKSVKCTNLGSYNYLGFGGVDEYCTPLVAKCIRETGLSTGSTRGGIEGTHVVHKELERRVAEFLDKEDAFVIGMGFATNSTIIPCLIDPAGNGKGCLILSDELNHKSIIEGVRMSWVSVKSFQHNDMVDLERKLKQACDVGQPNGLPWRKILVIVEGIYSMEGDFARLREIVALKDKYGALLYLDEAHSIGAVGESGRGITELLGVPRSKIDVMMGTFTKSFGSAGGYIAADAKVIANLRKNSPNATFAPAMSPACAAQALAALDLLKHERGKAKIESLRRNSNHFRRRLAEIGFWVLGDEDSPVVPVLMDQESMWYFSVKGMQQGVAIVVVCAPATPYMLPRARFCVSAAHTIEQIDQTLVVLEKLGKQLGILFRKNDKCLTNPAYYNWLRDAPLEVGRYEKTPKFEPLGMVEEYSEPEPIATTKDAAKKFGVFDPLGLIQDAPASLPNTCEQYLSTHGFGTCGPRGFYGTTMEHLSLEKALSDLLQAESAIFYAQGVSVASSVLASPMLGAKDLVFCFGKCHYGIKSGLRLNGKCTLVFVEDMRELQDWLSDWKKVERIDREKVGFREGADLFGTLPERFTTLEREIVPLDEYGKRFLVAEGLYQCDGSICDLPRLAQLKDLYRLSLVVDETLSLGGVAPRGVCEYFQMPQSTVDIYLGSLEFAIGSVGGFCAGQFHAVRDLRLTSSGYCFSASAPGVSCLWSKEVLEELQWCTNPSTSSLHKGACSEDGGSTTPSTDFPEGSTSSTSVEPSSRVSELSSSSSQEGDSQNLRKRRSDSPPEEQAPIVPPTPTSGLHSRTPSSCSSSGQSMQDKAEHGSTTSSTASEPHSTSMAGGKIVNLQHAGMDHNTSGCTTVAATESDDDDEKQSSRSQTSESVHNCSFENLRDRWTRLQQITEKLQTSAKRILSEKYEVRGSNYVIHLKPKILIPSTSHYSSGDSDSGLSDSATRGRQFSVHSSTRKSVCEKTRIKYQKALEAVKAATGLDIFERPLTERALDTRLCIHTEWTPTLRIAVSCLHTPEQIDSLLTVVRDSATW